MFQVDPGRRLAMDELREGFWRWDPLGFTLERDLLSNEYDDQVERTLDLLEQDAYADEVELDLVDWLRRRRGGRRAVGANASTAEATDPSWHGGGSTRAGRRCRRPTWVSGNAMSSECRSRPSCSSRPCSPVPPGSTRLLIRRTSAVPS